MLQVIVKHHYHDVSVYHARILWEKAETAFARVHRALLFACNYAGCLVRVAWPSSARYQHYAARVGGHLHPLLVE